MTDLSSLPLPPDGDWEAYFAQNPRLVLDFSQEIPLSVEERRRIFPSLRAFAQGECSDGSHLLAAASSYASRSGDPAYPPALTRFVSEENRHSSYLRAFLSFHGALPRTHPAPDSPTEFSPLTEFSRPSRLDHCFRRLRRLGSLKCELTVLLTAEIIALSYYDALSACTSSPALQSICAKMLADELPHILFGSQSLAKQRPRPWDSLLRRLLMEGTLRAVWLPLRAVLSAGGYPFSRFRRESLNYLNQSIAITKEAPL